MQGKQDLLKVVFYSPLSQDFLIKLKPDNYVLKLLPFIECNYDGKFSYDLQRHPHDERKFKTQRIPQQSAKQSSLS